MHQTDLSRFGQKLTPLTACVAVVFASFAPVAIAALVPVTTCLDSGAGSLRAAVTAAASGDTVDMTSLTCSSITLTSGEIDIGKDLKLKGPGADKLRIDGNGNGRVLYSSASTFVAYDLTFTNGYVYSHIGAANGGCIEGIRVTLYNSNVTGCRAQTYSGSASGGGIYAGGLYLHNSTVSSNSVGCYGGGTATGGGTVAYNMRFYQSSISHNAANCRAGGVAQAGGVSSQFIGASYSTVSNNVSSGDYGGVVSGISLFFLNSTVSGNTATGLFGGVASGTPGTTNNPMAYTNIENSTIAFNVAGAGSVGTGEYRSAGLAIGAGTVTLFSSLIANNVYGVASTESDFSLGSGTAAGSHNLIRAATSSVPVDTIVGTCPLLGPLRDNGGPTRTHALLSHSPGIDTGSNTGSNATNDQRGSPFVRVDHGAADIGAYEVQQEDIVFNSGFESCP